MLYGNYPGLAWYRLMINILHCVSFLWPHYVLFLGNASGSGMGSPCLHVHIALLLTAPEMVRHQLIRSLD